jgi:hypothetical protein
MQMSHSPDAITLVNLSPHRMESAKLCALHFMYYCVEGDWMLLWAALFRESARILKNHLLA